MFIWSSGPFGQPPWLWGALFAQPLGFGGPLLLGLACPEPRGGGVLAKLRRQPDCHGTNSHMVIITTATVFMMMTVENDINNNQTKTTAITITIIVPMCAAAAAADDDDNDEDEDEGEE